jgi:hypothetical protein
MMRRIGDEVIAVLRARGLFTEPAEDEHSD